MVGAKLVLLHLKNNSRENELFEHFYTTKTHLPVAPVAGMFIDLKGFINEEIKHLESLLDVRKVKRIVIINDEEVEVWLI